MSQTLQDFTTGVMEAVAFIGEQFQDPDADWLPMLLLEDTAVYRDGINPPFLGEFEAQEMLNMDSDIHASIQRALQTAAKGV